MSKGQLGELFCWCPVTCSESAFFETVMQLELGNRGARNGLDFPELWSKTSFEMEYKNGGIWSGLSMDWTFRMIDPLLASPPCIHIYYMCIFGSLC